MSSKKNGESLEDQNKNINASPNNNIPPHTALFQSNTFLPSKGPKGIKLNSPSQMLIEKPVANMLAPEENNKPRPKNIIAST